MSSSQHLPSSSRKARPFSARAAAFFAGGSIIVAGLPLFAQQAVPPAGQQVPPPSANPRPCRVTGKVTSGADALPGVSITAKSGEKTVALTSTDLDGNYSVPVAPGTYTIRLELTAFAAIERTVTAGAPPCEVQQDVTLQLASRVPGYVPPPPPAAPPPAATTVATPPAGTAAAGATTGGAAAPPAQGQAAGGRGGRQGGPGAARFQTLTVQQSDATAAAGNDVVADVMGPGRGGADDPAARLLPPGFSLGAPVESITVAGSMVEVDRNMLNDRMQALGRGEFGLGEGQFGMPGQTAGLLPGAGGPGGPGDAGRGGGGGRGGGLAGGLGGRIGGANRLQVSANYSMGGSLLDAAPYQLRDQVQPKRDYLQQTFSTTVGGPVRIPGVYNGTSRTTFNFTYSGGRNGDLFDQYATVPSEAYRRGDFSASPVAIIDPVTGQPFPDNQIPANRISQTARELLGLIPDATLSGDTRNFRRTNTTQSTNDSFSLRITHSFTPPPVAGGRGGGRGGGAPGTAGRAGGAGAATGASAAAAPATAAGATATPPATTATPPPTGAATATPPATATAPPAAGATGTATAGRQGGQPGQAGQGRGGTGVAGQGRGGPGGRGIPRPPQLNVSMNASITYRRNQNDRLSVFDSLDSATNGTTVSVPVSLNIRYGRSTHAINTSFSQTKSTSSSAFGFVRDVAGLAGIGGVSTDPFDWGVPTINFGSFTALRDVSPSRRNDRSFSAGYSWTRPAGSHTWRFGGDYQQSWNDSLSNSNARGSFTFTGLYTAGGLTTVRGSGQDFADFLLGMPQQATRSYSIAPDAVVTPIQIRGRSFGVYVQDDWRWKPRWTINYGVRYDYIAPFYEANGHMVNLDATPDFTAVAPVVSGETGPFSGGFPKALVNADANNVAPRVGVAWRATNRAVVRFGYGLTYNGGTYNSIARQLYQQPPFFLTGTSLGTLADPLTMVDPFSNITPSTVTNTFGIDPRYVLGLIHQWSADYSRDLFRTWSVGATYFGTLGRDLDILRAPNRGPDGLRIPDVQAFTWQSSEGASYANGVTLRLQKRQTRGIAGNVTYTLAKARDNTTATGGGATVAQDDRNLDAEWAVSSFDRRHQVTGSISVELPWGRNRSWLDQGGWLASIVGGWSLSTNMNFSSGAPTTIRCSTCASDVARGTGGTLRADYNGLPIELPNPTIDQFFNTEAFSVPAAGTFGNSLRNMVIGPGSKSLNANFTRDVAIGRNRSVAIQVTANNLLNLVVYRGVDTNVNSITFGQVTSVAGMRTMRLNLRFRF